jgi:hypothetical protein
MALANKENNGFGSSKGDHLFAGMDTAGKEEAERDALFVRCQMGCRGTKNHVAIHLCDIPGGISHRGANTSNTQQTTENKKKASLALANDNSDPPLVGTLRGP